jgi:hypothetical protein
MAFAGIFNINKAVLFVSVAYPLRHFLFGVFGKYHHIKKTVGAVGTIKIGGAGYAGVEVPAFTSSIIALATPSAHFAFFADRIVGRIFFHGPSTRPYM